jgi:hypothetical protein
MTERDFVYWLQGYLEVSGAKEISPEQVQIIKDHIGLVLKKVTPQYKISTTPAIGPYLGGGVTLPQCPNNGLIGNCNCQRCQPLIAVC